MAKLNLSQQQRQLQRLSPQQIQYIKLLQLPTLALEQRIKAELEINPVLEDDDSELELAEDKVEITTEETAPSDEKKETLEDTDKAQVDEKTPDDEFDWDEYLENSEDLYGYKSQSEVPTGEVRNDSPVAYQGSLMESLYEQIGLQNFTEKQAAIAEQIIGSIDEDGYLRRSLEAIIDDVMFSNGLNVEEEEAEEVLAIVQQFEPVGIATRNLQECLLVQLSTMPPDPEVIAAMNVLKKCYHAFSMKHFDQIKRKLDITEVELKKAFDVIQSLNPKPGEGAFQSSENYLMPDFTVEYENGTLVILLNGKNTPPLRISKGYRQMWEDLTVKKKQSSKSINPKENDTRRYLKDRMEAARWFINSLNQRRQTMMKVMVAIVETQEDFFKFGEGYLRPMILKDIATHIEMDISTVSRVVSNKYVQTEFGTYSLKFFFSEGLTTDSGEEVSNKEIKSLIQHMIEEEHKVRPLSDQRLVEMLEEKGYQIARRTVTKYREQLNIPVARLRKQIML